MKKLLTLAALVVAGLIAFNFATTGEFKLVPAFSKSPEQQAVQLLAERFDAARGEISQAQRSAGLAGIDTTSDADGALHEVEAVRRELASLQKKLSDEKAQNAARDLARDLDAFVRSL